MNMYRVTYQSSNLGNTGVYVVASTQDLAIAAALAADSRFLSVLSVSQIASSVIVGS